MPRHHEIFSSFERWSGNVPAGFDVDFLGSRYKTAYFKLFEPQPQERYATPKYPPFDEEYLEWIDLLEAVACAKDRFTMLELGAGFGRWTARAAAACMRLNLRYLLVAVEAEPTHFEWMIQNLQDNEVRMQDCRLIRAAVTGKDGKIGFHVGNAASSYGQCVGGSTELDAVSLATLLLPLDLIDLIDMDVQGAEFDVLTAAAVPLSQKVKRVHVETHGGRLHASIQNFFRELGWKPHFLFAGNTADKTPWGQINFQDGTLSWLNPRLCSKDEVRRAEIYQNSPTWRVVNFGRMAIDRLAPPETLRRKVFNATLSGIGKKYRRDPRDIARRDARAPIP